MLKLMRFALLVGFFLSSIQFSHSHSHSVGEDSFEDSCPVIGNPVVNGSCIASISRYLARTMHLDGFSRKFNWNNPTLGGNPCDCTDDPMDCSRFICEDMYNDVINMAVDAKASFLNDAFNSWSFMHRLNRTVNPMFETMENAVEDINQAYDCALLRRPIIQGTIFSNITEDIEWMNINSTAGGNDIIDFYNTVEGDDGVFAEELDAYIQSKGGTMPQKFVYDDMTNIPDKKGFLELTSVPSRLYLLKIGKMYIDAGYTSIMLGVAQQWAYYDGHRHVGSDQDPFFYAHHTLQILRRYAEQKNQVLLIASESLRNTDMTYQNSDDGKRYMLFDFDSLAMRMQESEEDSEELDCEATGPNCDDPEYIGDNLGNLTFTLPESCEDVASMAWINTCGVAQARTCPGDDLVSPNGCDYSDGVPYILGFDFGGGVNFKNDNCPNSPDSYLPTDHTELLQHVDGYEGGAYCMDDLFYFTQYLPPECARDWWMLNVCALSDIDNGFGHIKFPGLWRPRIQSSGQEQYIPETVYFEWHMPFDDSNSSAPILDAAMELWDPENLVDNSLTAADLEIDSEICENPLGSCAFNVQKLEKKYFFSVKNPDCTSTYTWHIRKFNDPDVTPYEWLPKVYGKTLELSVPESGHYKISLRRDNTEFPGPYDTQGEFAIYYLESECCCPTTVNVSGSIQLPNGTSLPLSPFNQVSSTSFTVETNLLELSEIVSASWSFESNFGTTTNVVTTNGIGHTVHFADFNGPTYGLLTMVTDCGSTIHKTFDFYPAMPPFVLYPNPFCETFAIEGQETSMGEETYVAQIKGIQVSDIYGTTVYNQEIPAGPTTWEMSSSNLSNGIYQVRIKDQFETLHYKMIEKFCY